MASKPKAKLGNHTAIIGENDCVTRNLRVHMGVGRSTSVHLTRDIPYFWEFHVSLPKTFSISNYIFVVQSFLVRIVALQSFLQTWGIKGFWKSTIVIIHVRYLKICSKWIQKFGFTVRSCISIYFFVFGVFCVWLVFSWRLGQTWGPKTIFIKIIHIFLILERCMHH